MNKTKTRVINALLNGKKYSSTVFLRDLKIYNRFLELSKEVEDIFKNSENHKLAYSYMEIGYFYEILAKEFNLTYHHICSKMNFIESLTNQEIEKYKEQAKQNLI